MERQRALIALALLIMAVPGCAAQAVCPRPPADVPISASQVTQDKVPGVFLDSPNFSKLLKGLQDQKTYQNSLLKAAQNGGCQ